MNDDLFYSGYLILPYKLNTKSVVLLLISHSGLFKDHT